MDQSKSRCPQEASRPRRPNARNLAFLGEFFRTPRATGAVLPSSSELSRLMVEWLDFESLQTLVEFGPGTGSFTLEIAERLKPGAKYLGLEINPSFAAHLRGMFPDFQFHERSAAEVRLCPELPGDACVDAIVSGLPWAVFSEQEQEGILQAAVSVLKDRGCFATFAYLQGLMLPAGRRFRKKLRGMFSSVETSRVAWRNVPPAFVYRCRK
jgi:phosphatidylethanolamine/phosphatidyl-N-methylethanolamine N-methyltransferase